MAATLPVSTSQRVYGSDHATPSVAEGRRLNWLGILLFGVLMAYPFVVQYLPLGVRQYLSATLR